MFTRASVTALIAAAALGWSAPARAQGATYPITRAPARPVEGAEEPEAPPGELSYREPIPEGYHAEVQEGHGGLIKAGWITLASGYAVSAVVATVGLTGGDSLRKEYVEPGWGYLPLAGGFIVVARNESAPCDECWSRVLFYPMTLLPAAAQVVAAGLLIGGYSVERKVLVRDEMAAGEIRVAPVPLGAGGMGLGAAGRF